MPSVPAGRLRVRVTHAGFAPLIRDVEVKERWSSAEEIALSRGAHLRGRVTGIEEGKRRNLLVSAVSPSDPSPRTAATDEEGRFDIGGLADAVYTVVVSAPRRGGTAPSASTASATVEVQGGDVEVVLEIR